MSTPRAPRPDLAQMMRDRVAADPTAESDRRKAETRGELRVDIAEGMRELLSQRGWPPRKCGDA